MTVWLSRLQAAVVGVAMAVCLAAPSGLLAQSSIGTVHSWVGAPSVSVGPSWLAAYPNAQLRKHAVDPLQRTLLPLSMPEQVGARSTRFQLQMEGKVTLLQYRHEATESPLLIQRHYDALLAQAGFERVVACAEPCPRSGGAARWMGVVDANRAVDYSFFPDAPTILIGYKADAAVLVAIGKNSNFPYATTIKLVEGRMLAPGELQAWLDWLKQTPPTTPATPAQVAPPLPGTSGNSTAFDAAGIEIVPPAQLTGMVRDSKGRLVVMLSSRDARCPFCVRTNPRYSAMVKAHPQAARYAAVFWEPWLDAFKADPLLSTSIRGLPVYLVFEDRKLVNKVMGDQPDQPLDVQVLEQRNAPPPGQGW